MGPVCLQGPWREHGAVTLFLWETGKVLECFAGCGRACARTGALEISLRRDRNGSTETGKRIRGGKQGSMSM